jgi:hypothetical protein
MQTTGFSVASLSRRVVLGCFASLAMANVLVRCDKSTRRANHSNSCPVLHAKIFRLTCRQLSGIIPRVSPVTRGGSRSSRTRGGMRWTRKVRKTFVPDAYGEVVWSRRRGAGVKLRRVHARCSDGGKRAVLRREHEVSRKATAQGRPGCSRWTCMLVCASFCAQLHTRPRVQRAPGLPCALYFRRGRTNMQTSGRTCREIAKSY